MFEVIKCILKMILRKWSVFLTKHFLKRANINFKMYFTLNSVHYRKQLFLERNRCVFNSKKILKRNVFTSNCEVKPLSSALTESNRTYSSNFEELDFDNIDLLEEKLSSKILRNHLCPDSDDPVVVKLKETTNVEELFNIVHKYADEFNAERCAQTVLVIWDLQRQCRNSFQYCDVYISRNELFDSYMSELRNHEMFVFLLNLLDKYYNEMSPDALACSILYLTRMGIDYNCDVIHNMICKIDSLLDSAKPGEIPLSALSRFILALSGLDMNNLQLRYKISLLKALPHVEHWIGEYFILYFF